MAVVFVEAVHGLEELDVDAQMALRDLGGHLTAGQDPESQVEPSSLRLGLVRWPRSQPDRAPAGLAMRPPVPMARNHPARSSAS